MLSYRSCTLCPRRCGVDREAGELGFCRMPGSCARRAPCSTMARSRRSVPITARARCFSAAARCAAAIARMASSRPAARRDADAGGPARNVPAPHRRGRAVHRPCHADPFSAVHPPALTPRLPVPVIYNCGGYESVETLRELEGLIDIYLPDYKYADPELAARLSGRAGLPSRRGAALREMYRQVGGTELDEDGQMIKGMLVRHLVLPGVSLEHAGRARHHRGAVPGAGRFRFAHEPVCADGQSARAARPRHHPGGI